MPQADPDLVRLIVSRFGDIDTTGPAQFLECAGYKLTRDCHWLPKSGVTDYGQMTRDEFDCLMFLCHEWDFGGLRLEKLND